MAQSQPFVKRGPEAQSQLKQVEQLLGGGEPDEEVLLEEARDRVTEAPAPREMRGEIIAGLSFLAASLALIALFPANSSPDVLTIIGFVGIYALASQIRFDVGTGWTVPTQLVLVPMLLLLAARLRAADGRGRQPARRPAGAPHPPPAPRPCGVRLRRRLVRSRSRDRHRDARAGRPGGRALAGLRARAREPDRDGLRGHDCSRVVRARGLAAPPARGLRLDRRDGRAARPDRAARRPRRPRRREARSAAGPAARPPAALRK